MKIFLVNSFQTFPGNYFNHGLSFATRVRPSPPMFQKTCPLSHRIQKGQDIGGRATPPPYNQQSTINMVWNWGWNIIGVVYIILRNQFLVHFYPTPPPPSPEKCGTWQSHFQMPKIQSHRTFWGILIGAIIVKLSEFELRNSRIDIGL